MDLTARARVWGEGHGDTWGRQPAAVPEGRAHGARCRGRRDLCDAYERIFEASGGLCCSPNETDHVADSPQEGLRRTYELADVAGFYRAFGVEVQPGTERADHVAAELEFMHLLAVKEVVTIDQSDAEERAEICREAARDFLRDHLGRFAPRLAERLEEASTEPFYAAAGQLLDRFVAGEAQRLGAA